MTTRLGVRMGDRPLMTAQEVERGFDVLRSTSARSVLALEEITLSWIIQTDREHVDHVRGLCRTGLELPSTVALHVVGRSNGGFEDHAFDGVALPDRYLCLRLDSDDYYFAAPIAAALRRFAPMPEGTLVDFPRGYLLEHRTGRARRMTYSVQGPFYGIITSPDDPIAARGHHGRAREGRTCVEQLSRSWIQSVHGGNSVTEYRPLRRGREIKSLVKQMQRARGDRPLPQILVRPFDLVPLRRKLQRSLHRTVT